MSEPSQGADALSPGWPVRLAGVFDPLARWSLWLIALFVLVVIPWFFGGMGPEGYWFTVWAGRACLLPLGLWAVSSFLLRRRPPLGFWVAVVCWGGLAVQVLVSMENKCQAPQAPWLGNGFDPVEYNRWLPTTAFRGGTQALGRLWLSYGLLALSAYVIGIQGWALRVLLWVFGVNVAVLAGLGIPYKYSGNYLMLGRWEMDQNYFYSTFIYHNHWCAYALLGLATVVGLGAEQRRMWVRVLLVVMAALIAASAPISVSRLGTLLMAAFLGFVGLVWLRRQLATRRKGLWRGLVLAGCAVAVLGVVGAGVAYLNRHGPGSAGQRTWGYIIKANPFGSRIMLVEDSVPMVAEKPLTGWGLGAFGAAFRKYQRPESIVVYNQGRETRYEHCHNDWMERLVELGFVGVLLMAAPVVYWLLHKRREGLPAVNSHAFWMLSGLVFLWVFALGDMVFDNRCVCGVTVVLIGFLLRMRSLESGKA
jgi:O-antigen ligase